MRWSIAKRLWQGHLRPRAAAIAHRVPGSDAIVARVRSGKRRPAKKTEPDRLFTQSGGQFSYADLDRRLGELLEPSVLATMKEYDRIRLQRLAGPVRFGTLSPSADPDVSLAFATVCTDKFAPGLEAFIVSLLDVHPDIAADFFVYHDGGLSLFSQSRLKRLYSGLQFVEVDTSPYERAAAGSSPNQRRIGALGYLTIEALRLDTYDRVIVFDADLLVAGDISPLWSAGDMSVRVVADAGALPFTTRSDETGEVILNSGVISLPRSACGEEMHQKALELLPSMPDVSCPILTRFADQKFWNIYLQQHPLVFLPATYNTNKQLLDRFYPDQVGEAAIIHYTSSKPWFTFASDELVTKAERRRARRDQKEFSVTFGLWHQRYRSLAGSRWRAAYRDEMSDTLTALAGQSAGGGCALIGNGPSLQQTDLGALADRTTMAFNWFVNHDEFDEVRVNHLLLLSHMFFGGWHTPTPAFPRAFLDALMAREHRPMLWFSYYFRDLVESTPELEGFEKGYMLLEKPFKVFAEDLGYLKIDLGDFLSDAHTGVLTGGLPLALHLGCTDIVLVGCDASYGRVSGGDYFYEQAQHTSKSTTTSSLHRAWEDGGAAQYCYKLGVAAAHERGASLTNATIGGYLEHVPRVELPGLRRPQV